jgi:1-aminocyclopropane-1-carboxylate deaminase/D-cysteine desulfhydrase-like pyridoxal-dependent ACC family enzyme
MTLAQLQSALAAVRRVPLAKVPTPLDELERLGPRLGIRLLLKREDLTGLALGGNKTRMFEYLMADAMEKQADVVVGGAAAQSNYCRQLSAACAALGLELHLFLREVRGKVDRDSQGNLLLDFLFGAKVWMLEVSPTEQRVRMEAHVEELRRAGRRPYFPQGEKYLGALALMARTEGILLDPVYTSKALVGLQDLVRRGVVRKGQTVVFVHTGGLPALFAHTEALTAAGLTTLQA